MLTFRVVPEANPYTLCTTDSDEATAIGRVFTTGSARTPTKHTQKEIRTKRHRARHLARKRILIAPRLRRRAGEGRRDNGRVLAERLDLEHQRES